MFQVLLRNAIARGGNTLDDVDDIAWRAMLAFLCLIAMVPVMWGLNVIGWKGANYVFLFGGIAITAIWAFAPTKILWAMGAGALVQGLKDEDITKGAVAGITTWYQVILGVMLWIAIVAGILATISFKESPASFFPIAGMLLLVTLAFASVKSKWLKAIIGGFAVAVIVYHAWQITPREWKEELKSATSSPAKGVELPARAPSARRQVTLKAGETMEIEKNGYACSASSVAAKGKIETVEKGGSWTITAKDAVTFKFWTFEVYGYDCPGALKVLSETGRLN